MLNTSSFSLLGTPLIASFLSILLPSPSPVVSSSQLSIYGFQFGSSNIHPTYTSSGFPSIFGIPIGNMNVPNIGFPYGWNTTIGVSYGPMFGGINVYDESQFFGGTHVYRYFPFLCDIHPFRGFAQLEEVPWLGEYHVLTIVMPLGALILLLVHIRRTL